MTIRVGVNAHDPMVYFLSRHPEWLEHELEPLGETVQWRGYAPGYKAPEFLGSELDFVGCGQRPMLTAQADGLPVVYVGASPSRPDQGALLVRSASAFQSPADLVGRRVAVALGAWPGQFVSVALANAGVSINDVTVTDPPGNALDQLLDGQIDAWAALGPRLVEAEETGDVRRLIPTQSAISNRALWTVHKQFALEREDVVAAILRAIECSNRWVESHYREAATIRAADTEAEAASWGGDAHSWEAMLRRMPWTIAPIEADFIAEQQRASEVLYAAGQLTRSIDVNEAFLPGLAQVVTGARRTVRAQPLPDAGAAPVAPPAE